MNGQNIKLAGVEMSMKSRFVIQLSKLNAKYIYCPDY